VPRTDEADPMRMLNQLAKLIGALHNVPVVLLIDQLEDMANQSAPAERFVKVVDAITAFTHTVPNAIVVLACLGDYFELNVANVSKGKLDRLIVDPEPLRLMGNRTLEDIHTMTARRLAFMYATADVPMDPTDELYPFCEADLKPLAGMRARDALDYLRRHHQRCITLGRWEQPVAAGNGTVVGAGKPPPPADGLVALWNDFHTSFQATVPDTERELAGVLAGAVHSIANELPEGIHFSNSVWEGRYLNVQIHKPAGGIESLLVAVCNAPAGMQLIGQIAELEKRLGERPAAIVRSTDFPKTGKAIAQIGALLKRDGRRVIVADADWRRMQAFVAFRKQHAARPDFAAWQKSARPLGELDSLQKILKLSALVATPRPRPADIAKPPAIPPQAPKPPAPVLAPPPLQSPAAKGPLSIGRTLGLVPAHSTIEPNDLVQHAAFLGGSGSGKTTAALNLIEQLLARDIPAVLMDRKGDLCRYADPAAWERPLNDPARAASRNALRSKLDVALYTPGKPNGRPLALPVVPPGFAQLEEAEREHFAQYAAAALGSMIGFKTSDADKAQKAILAKAIETLATMPDIEITVAVLRNLIESQDAALLNAIGGGYSEKYYEKLAERLHTLELNNKHLLSGGEQLDIDALLGTGTHARPGRVRLSVISTRFLGDAARVDFWMAQFLVAVSRWCARSPLPHLQAVFLFDEADMYLPAVRQPAAKAPMEDLLKRARSAGVGLFLATQSPGDFDYKCKENVRTWLIGRVKEPRALEKLKPMLSAAKVDVSDKLAGQAAGEFYSVRESNVTPLKSDESFMRTEQLSEDQIAELARNQPGVAAPFRARHGASCDV